MQDILLLLSSFLALSQKVAPESGRGLILIIICNMYHFYEKGTKSRYLFYNMNRMGAFGALTDELVNEHASERVSE